ncbi:MAG: 30S ribosomal protein S1 [Anaerovibrio sp.]|nr:30S ribosomal protein S1 [Anaerovibrio sp.]MCR5176580.1 30S ribosomal protein S1 [Anaerovibrio sp.]
MEAWLAKEDSMKEIHERDLVEAVVVAVNDNEAIVNIQGNKNDVPISKFELAEPAPESAKDVVKVDDVIEVLVVAKGGENGLTVSKVKADRLASWKELDGVVEKGEPIEAEITQVVKGGLVARALGVRAFIPASQIELNFVKDLSKYVGQTVKVLPIELDPSKQRLVLSRRQLLETELKSWLENIKEGDVVKGTVKRLVSYGAFIDIGGIDGLVHISDFSWERVKNPSDVLEEGQEIDVKIKSIAESEDGKLRISLSVKDTMPDPWVVKAEKYNAGDIISGEIVGLKAFGAFMRIEQGLDGLIPMGELADRRIKSADEVVAIGDQVTVKILNVDIERKRISLSMKQANESESGDNNEDAE